MLSQYFLDNWALIALYFATFLVVILLSFVVWTAYKDGLMMNKNDKNQQDRILSSDLLRKSFDQAIKLIENSISDKDQRENISWTLVFNEGHEARPLPLLHSGISKTLNPTPDLVSESGGISWSFFDQGIVVQMLGSYLGDSDHKSDSESLETFLKLCQIQRPDKPLDSLVVTLPAKALLLGGPEAIQSLVSRAKLLHRRLWFTQNTLNQRLPIYIVISECESIAGFTAFANSLPLNLRKSILGWSSPHDLLAPFEPIWIDSGMDQMIQSLNEVCDELCATQAMKSYMTDFFFLPTEVEKLKEGLRIFSEELMRSNTFHYPFLLRGFYLTGDTHPSAYAQSSATKESIPNLSPGDLIPINSAQDQPEINSVIAPSTSPFDNTSNASNFFNSHLERSHNSRLPVFLVDIFDEKIFQESGLSKWASKDRLRPETSKIWLRNLRIAIPCVWGIGILATGIEVQALSQKIAASFEKLQKYEVLYGSNLNPDSITDPSTRRQLAQDALNNIEQVASGHLFSFFMPGSWPMFDDLSSRVQEQMEKRFTTNSYEILVDTVNLKITELTNIQFDMNTGEIKSGSHCSYSKGWAEFTKAPKSLVLNINDLPEFKATLDYAEKAREIDIAVQALLRLRSSNGTASGKDLKLALKYLLGFQLEEKDLDRRSKLRGENKADRAAELFRGLAQRAPQINLEPMHTALACTMNLDLSTVYHKFFTENDLLKTSQELATKSKGIMLASASNNDAVTSPIPKLQELLDALVTQESILKSAKGEWIKDRPMNLGGNYNSLLQQIENNSLLSKNFAEETEKQANLEFNKFLIAWDFAQAQFKSSINIKSGLEWSEKNARWVLTSDQLALLGALDELLFQPYMKPAKYLSFPKLSPNTPLRWNLNYLDQVLSLNAADKNFQTNILPKFPSSVQQLIANITKNNIAILSNDLLAQAVSSDTKSSESNTHDIEIAKLNKIRNWLSDLGADYIVDDINDFLKQDALARLQILDNSFAKADIFVPKEKDITSWDGGRSAILKAFGANDEQELIAYVEQQINFTDNYVKLSRPLIQQYGNVGVNIALIKRWQAIGDDLDKYKLKNPSNNLSQLEQFILTVSSDLDLSNCLTKLAYKANLRQNGNFFFEQLIALKSGLYARCLNLKLSNSKETWLNFANNFNENIANRSPFISAESSAVASSNNPNSQKLTADLNDLGNALSLFNKAHNSINWKTTSSGSNSVSSSAPNSNSFISPTIKQFDEQMQKINELFAPLIASDDGQAGGLDLLVELRANKAYELEGNKIIDWYLTVGKQTIHLGEPQKTLTWTYGLPISMTLQFAKDWPAYPMKDSLDARVTFNDKSITMQFDDPWALFTFINKYRVPDTNSNSDSKSQLLRFDFPLSLTKMTSSSVVSKPDVIARLFLRTRISALGKRSQIVWPSTLGVKVPAWIDPN